MSVYTQTPEQMARDYVPRYHPRYDRDAERPLPARLLVHRADIHVEARSHVSDLSPEQMERAAAARGAVLGRTRQSGIAWDPPQNRLQRITALLRAAGELEVAEIAARLGLLEANVRTLTADLRGCGTILVRSAWRKHVAYRLRDGQEGAA